MLQNLDSYFDELIVDRVNDIAIQVMRENDEVKKLKKNSINLLNKIMEILSEKDKNMVFRYEEKRNEEELLNFQIIYKQGLADGLKIGNISNEIRNKDILGL